jgi:hypothetical protein
MQHFFDHSSKLPHWVLVEEKFVRTGSIKNLGV